MRSQGQFARFSWLVCFAFFSAGARSQEAEIAPPSVQVASSVTGLPVSEAFVTVAIGSAVVSAVTGMDGVASLPGLGVPPPAVPDTPPVYVLVEVHRVGYLPFKKKLEFGDQQRTFSCGLVPDGVGYNTPLIRSAHGGRFDLAGLGILRVAPNALTQDVVLRVIPLPESSWTNTLSVAEVLRYQVWLQAFDTSGLPAPAALPLAPGSIILETDVPNTILRPDGVLSETWTTHCVGYAFAHDLTCIAQQVSPGNDRVMVPLGAGHNLLYQSYSTPAESCSGLAGPWTYDVVFVGLRTNVIVTVPVLCGTLTASGGCSVKAGEEIKSSLTWTEADHRKYGLEGKSVVGKVNVEVGFSSSYSEEQGKVITTAREGSMNKADGSTISGRPSGQQGQGYDCLTGDAHFGEIFKRYAVWAKRRWVCDDGSIHSEGKKVAEVEIFVGLQNWYAVPWDESCPGCQPAGTPPAVPQPR